MNWILVRYPRRRRVYVDDAFLGYTNRKLLVGEDGTYTVHLGKPVNYSPARRRPRVSGATRRNPLELVFTAHWQ